MKNNLLPFMLLLLSLAFSCRPLPEIDEHHATDIHIVTGLHLREHDGSSRGTLGNPNTKAGTIEAYPNPADDVLSVHSSDTIQKVWITVGFQETGFQDTDFESLFQSLEHQPADLEIFTAKIFNPASSIFNLDVSDLPSGYRRIFYLMQDNTIRWDNLFIDHERPFPTSVNQLIEDWN